MTTPSAPQSPDPEDSSELTPAAESPAAEGDAPSEPPAESQQPAPVPAEASAPAEPPPPQADDSQKSGGGPFGFIGAHKLLFFGGGGAVVVIVVVVVALFAMGMFGGGGGAGGSSDAYAYILDDSSYNTVEVINVASILSASELPATMQTGRLDMPYLGGFDDPEDWKDEWRESSWYSELPVSSSLFSEVPLDDLTTVIMQNVDGSTGYILTGNFAFNDLRDIMEDMGWEEDTYREFEVWDNRNVALLEDSGVILLEDNFVSSVLKAMDTGRGLIDGESVMKRVLDKVGSGLVVGGAADSCASYGSPGLRSCNGYAITVTGGTADTTNVKAAYLFGSSARAESSLEDIEEAILDTRDVDADIENIGTSGEFVTYELTIHDD